MSAPTGLAQQGPLSGRPAGGCKPQPLASGYRPNPFLITRIAIAARCRSHSSKARSRSKVWYSTQSHECPCSANYPRDHRTAHSRRFRVHLVDSVGSRHCRRVLFLVLCAAQKTAEVKFFLNRSSTPALRATDGNAGRRGETYPLQYGIGDRSQDCTQPPAFTDQAATIFQSESSTCRVLPANAVRFRPLAVYRSIVRT